MRHPPPKSVRAFDELPDDALIRLRRLMAWNILPHSMSTTWRRVRAKQFPAAIKLSPQITAFRVGDIRRWLANPAEYRQLVGESAGAARASTHQERNLRRGGAK